MSEKLFALLLRLYPARFRREYGDEAVQLFCDRMREERGLMPRARLWLDLLVDMALSLPREHRRHLHALAAAQPRPPAGEAMFLILEDRPPRLGSFVVGTVFALCALGIFVFLLNHGAVRHIYASGETTLTSDAGSSAQANGPAKGGASVSAPELDAEEQKRVIAGVIANLRRYYGHPSEEQRLAELLLLHEKSGDYAAIDRGNVFAAVLNQEIRSVTHDDALSIFSNAGVSDDGAGMEFSRVSFHRIDRRFGIQIP